MPNDPNLERRMNRLENETVAIYDMIDDFRSETRTRFDEVEIRFDGMETRFDGMETRLDETQTRFDEVQARFDRIETTLGEVLQRLPEPT